MPSSCFDPPVISEENSWDSCERVVWLSGISDCVLFSMAGVHQMAETPDHVSLMSLLLKKI